MFFLNTPERGFWILNAFLIFKSHMYIGMLPKKNLQCPTYSIKFNEYKSYHTWGDVC